MCGNPFKQPKAPAVAPPAPPAPPAPEPPKAPAYDDDDRTLTREREGGAVRRLGRKALRIDLQAPAAGGQGLRMPNK